MTNEEIKPNKNRANRIRVRTGTGIQNVELPKSLKILSAVLALEVFRTGKGGIMTTKDLTGKEKLKRGEDGYEELDTGSNE